MSFILIVSRANVWSARRLVVEQTCLAIPPDNAELVKELESFCKSKMMETVLDLTEWDVEKFNIFARATKQQYSCCLKDPIRPVNSEAMEGIFACFMDDWRELLARLEEDPRYHEDIAGPKLEGWVMMKWKEGGWKDDTDTHRGEGSWFS